MQAAVANNAYLVSRDPTCLDWALEAYEIAAGGLDGFKRPGMLLGQFAQLLIERYQLRQRPEDLDAAIRRLEQRLEYPMPASERVLSLAGIARLCVMSMGRSYGSAMEAKQSAVIDEIASLGSFDTAEAIGHVMDLGQVCQDLYTATGRLEQLASAIKCFGMLAAAIAPADERYGAVMSAFGNALGDRYLRMRSREDLERGLFCHRAAVAALRGAERATALSNLGTHLMHVFRATGDAGYMQEAVQVYRDSVAATDPASSVLAARLDNLGTALAERYDKVQDLADLNESAALHERALALLPPPNEVRVGILNNMALRVARQARITGRGGSRSWSLFRQACTEGLEVGFAEAMKAARNWINAAFERRRWKEVVDAYRYFDEAAILLVGQQQSRLDKESWLRELVHVSERAAYAFARRGDLEGAVMCLEHGTARLLSEALRAPRSEVTAESTGQPDRLTFADVSAAARRAPIVYVSCTMAGSLALIVRGSGHVQLVWLDALDERSLHRQLFGADRGGGSFGAYLRSRDDPSDRAAGLAWRTALAQVARWEGKALQPLFDRLERCDRIVLVAVGALSLLPWQATMLAGKRRNGRTHLIDRMQVTYAPNAGALRTATRAEASEPSTDVLLTVFDPSPTTARPLPYARLEALACGAQFQRTTVLQHDDASWSALIAELAEASVFHFAGHARANLDDPLRSGLGVAGDATLALEDILERSHRGKLAVLSACETSVAGLELLEESVSLATGFLQFGFEGVIASQWSVEDASTFLLMTRFYALWRRERMEAAEALRQAQRWVRDATPADLIAHLHDVCDVAGDQTAGELRTRFAALPRDSRPFASPFYWAPFAYWGR
jgi:CHAT domain-containing protein/tetratricopeptide (TPR) repeat protein